MEVSCTLRSGRRVSEGVQRRPPNEDGQETAVFFSNSKGTDSTASTGPGSPCGEEMETKGRRSRTATKQTTVTTGRDVGKNRKR